MAVTVGKDFSHPFDVLAPIGEDFSHVFDVVAPVGKDFSHPFDIGALTLAGISPRHEFDILGTVGIDISHPFEVQRGPRDWTKRVVVVKSRVTIDRP